MPRGPRSPLSSRPAFLLLLLLLLSGPGAARGHTPDETYLTLILTETNLVGSWDVALRDLRQGLALDPAALQRLAEPELEQRQEALALDTLSRLDLKADGVPLALKATDYLPVSLNNGEYVRVQFAATGMPGAPKRLELNARALFAVDISMHGFLRLEHGGRTDSVAFNRDRLQHSFRLTGPSDRWEQWVTFVSEGAWHIWIGFDHILFLTALLLPAVLRWEAGRWESVDRFQPALLNVVKIVTGFTVAHSLTLSLAMLEVVRLPVPLVESAIAASVALAAANNLWPWCRTKGWWVAFGFGLVHGFGFANVLAQLGLSGGSLALALVGFNVGVELGQLALAASFLPVAFALRASAFYHRVVFRLGSALVVCLALAWMVERMFGLKFLPI